VEAGKKQEKHYLKSHIIHKNEKNYHPNCRSIIPKKQQPRNPNRLDYQLPKSLFHPFFFVLGGGLSARTLTDLASGPAHSFCFLMVLVLAGGFATLFTAASGAIAAAAATTGAAPSLLPPITHGSFPLGSFFFSFLNLPQKPFLPFVTFSSFLEKVLLLVLFLLSFVFLPAPVPAPAPMAKSSSSESAKRLWNVGRWYPSPSSSDKSGIRLVRRGVDLVCFGFCL